MSNHKPRTWEKVIIVDAHAEIDLGVDGRYYRDNENFAHALQQEANDFHNFIRDHRSRDHYRIEIVRTNETQCQFCGDSDSSNEPTCCDRAIALYEQTKREVA